MSELHGVKKKLAFDFVICAYCSYEMLYQNHINGFKRAFIKRKGKKKKIGWGVDICMDGWVPYERRQNANAKNPCGPSIIQ